MAKQWKWIKNCFENWTKPFTSNHWLYAWIRNGTINFSQKDHIDSLFYHFSRLDFNPYLQILENSSRNFSEIFIFWVVTQAVLLENSSRQFFEISILGRHTGRFTGKLIHSNFDWNLIAYNLFFILHGCIVPSVHRNLACQFSFPFFSFIIYLFFL